MSLYIKISSHNRTRSYVPVIPSVTSHINNECHVSVGFPYKVALLSSLYVGNLDFESVGV